MSSSNEGDHTISNEGDNIISNEGANKKTDCYVGGVFKHSTGVGPPTRVPVFHTIESNDVVQSYRVTDEEGNQFETSSATLIQDDAIDVSKIPQTTEQYCKEAALLTPADLNHVVNPKILSPDQQELLSLHHKMGHTPFPRLIRMAETINNNVLRRLAYLKHNLPPEYNCPGKCVSIDHIVSAQPGLIPQMSGNLTRMRIWAVQVHVDHFSGHTHVHLMRDLSLEETLIAKASYERVMS